MAASGCCVTSGAASARASNWLDISLILAASFYKTFRPYPLFYPSAAFPLVGGGTLASVEKEIDFLGFDLLPRPYRLFVVFSHPLLHELFLLLQLFRLLTL